MEGIYNEEFIKYLKFHLGEDSVKIKSKNIICRCPWCEMDSNKNHYHLYISTEIPIFHCFYAGCSTSGSIKKLTKKISGLGSVHKFVDSNKINKVTSNFKLKKQNISNKKYRLPVLKINEFKEKAFYLNQRFGFINYPLTSITGLVFDVKQFINMNNIVLNKKQEKIIDFLQSNFIGFLSNNQSLLTLRNIDSSSSFRHYKLQINEPLLLDYYKIHGNPKGKKIILAEGIFDIFGEYFFDNLNIKNDVLLYACGYSTSYKALLKSISFYENVYKPEVIILSDRDVKIWFYKKLKKFNKHLYSKMSIFYNKLGKDFGDMRCIPELITI